MTFIIYAMVLYLYKDMHDSHLLNQKQKLNHTQELKQKLETEKIEQQSKLI